MTNLRIGQGMDVHRTDPSRRLVLGGVQIESDFGLLGHSDADVLCHAITDALLGSLALGDIGTHFPDTDPAYKGADSTVLLKNAYALVKAKGYKDCVALINESGVNIIVTAPEEGLSVSDTTKIKDIVVAETMMSPDKIKIIEIK